MSYFRALNKCKWWESSQKRGVLLANCLKCISTGGEKHSLSLWMVEKELQPVVVVQLTFGRARLDDFHYAAFPPQCLEPYALAAQQVDEKRLVADRLVGKHWNIHLDTAANLLAVGNAILPHAVLSVVLKWDLAQMMADAIRSDEFDLDLADLRKGVRKAVLSQHRDLAD